MPVKVIRSPDGQFKVKGGIYEEGNRLLFQGYWRSILTSLHAHVCPIQLTVDKMTRTVLYFLVVVAAIEAASMEYIYSIIIS